MRALCHWSPRLSMLAACRSSLAPLLALPSALLCLPVLRRTSAARSVTPASPGARTEGALLSVFFLLQCPARLILSGVGLGGLIHLDLIGRTFECLVLELTSWLQLISLVVPRVSIQPNRGKETLRWHDSRKTRNPIVQQPCPARATSSFSMHVTCLSAATAAGIPTLWLPAPRRRR